MSGPSASERPRNPRCDRDKTCLSGAIGGGAAAILTHIDDETVLPGTGRVELLLETLEAGIVHLADMQIAESALGRFFHGASVIFDPLVVEELAGGGVVDRAQGDFAVLASNGAHSEHDVSLG